MHTTVSSVTTRCSEFLFFDFKMKTSSIYAWSVHYTLAFSSLLHLVAWQDHTLHINMSANAKYDMQRNKGFHGCPGLRVVGSTCAVHVIFPLAILSCKPVMCLKCASLLTFKWRIKKTLGHTYSEQEVDCHLMSPIAKCVCRRCCFN